MSDHALRRCILCLMAGVFAIGMPVAVQAQSCPPGYYFASDGNCYPGPPPNYPPPQYDAAPPVSAPPLVADGLILGLGMLLGSALSEDHDRGRPPEEHRAPPPRRADRGRERGDEHGDHR
jgi:hypothetical protein